MQFPLPNQSAQSVEYVDGWFKTSPPCKVLEYSENFLGWSDDLTKIHDSLGDHPIDVYSRKLCIRSLKKYKNGSNFLILEIGCSSGKLIELIKSELNFLKIVGSDVVREPLHELADKINDVPLLKFDILQNPLPDESFDVIIALNVLEHIEDDTKALQNIYRLLKKDGIFIFELPAFQSLYDSYDSELQHFRRYNKSNILKKLKSENFLILDIHYICYSIFLPFLLVKLFNKVFRKKSVLKNNFKLSDNSLITIMLQQEMKLIDIIKLPFGIRIFGISRKK